jgi:hypothetical protein
MAILSVYIANMEFVYTCSQPMSETQHLLTHPLTIDNNFVDRSINQVVWLCHQLWWFHQVQISTEPEPGKTSLTNMMMRRSSPLGHMVNTSATDAYSRGRYDRPCQNPIIDGIHHQFIYHCVSTRIMKGQWSPWTIMGRHTSGFQTDSYGGKAKGKTQLLCLWPYRNKVQRPCRAWEDIFSKIRLAR